MGQSQPHSEVPNFAPTRVHLQQSVRQLIDHSSLTFSEHSCLHSIKTILQQLYFNPICRIIYNEQKPKYHFSRMITVIYANKRFGYCIIKLLTFLLKTIESIISFHSLFIVHIDDWRLGMFLAKIILVLTDVNSIQKIDQIYHLKQLGQLDQETEEVVKKIQSLISTHNNGNIIAKLQQVEAKKIVTTLRSSLNSTIKLRQKVLTRSKQTFQIINQYDQACFLLLLKVFLSQKFNKSLYAAACKDSEIMKSYFKIGAFFFVYGLQHRKIALYQAAVAMLLSIYQQIENIKQTDQPQLLASNQRNQSHGLPSYLFKNVPVCSSVELHQYILFYNLYSLQQETFHFNRILSLKLAKSIVKSKKIYMNQIEQLLISLSKKLAIQSIQRAFFCELVYCYLQDHQLSSSAKHLQKIADLNKISYRVTISNNRKLEISAETVLQSLYNNRIQTYQTSLWNACERYVYEHISSNTGQNKIKFSITDNKLWRMILPNQYMTSRNFVDNRAEDPSICNKLDNNTSLAEYKDENEYDFDQEESENRFDSMQVLNNKGKTHYKLVSNKKLKKGLINKLPIKGNDMHVRKQITTQGYAKALDLMLQSEKFRDTQQQSMNIARKVYDNLSGPQISF